MKSPEITDCRWGKVEIDSNRVFKDAVLFPGGASEWDWNETNTHHQPGIMPADVEKLLDNGAEYIILSKGYYERLDTAPPTFQLLDEKNIPYKQLQTEEAVSAYNRVRKEKPVGALIHSTC